MPYVLRKNSTIAKGISNSNEIRAIRLILIAERFALEDCFFSILFIVILFLLFVSIVC